MSKGMNKTELVEKYMESVMEKRKISRRQAEDEVNLVLKLMTDAVVEGDGLTLTGLFSMRSDIVAERQCRNPANGEVSTVPEHAVVRFYTGKKLKDRLQERLEKQKKES